MPPTRSKSSYIVSIITANPDAGVQSGWRMIETVMQHHRGVLTSALAFVLVASAFSQNPVGNWNGKIDFSGFKPKDANEKAMMDQMRPLFSSMRARLVVKKDHTYTADFTGGAKGQSKKDSGKWTQNGMVVVMTDKTGKSQKLSISKDGKTMINTPSAEEHVPSGVRLIFKRA